MGSTLTKEESAVVKLLQQIFSVRGLQYDSATLKSLLLWARRKDFIPCVNAAFEVQTWADIGAKLWEEISTGSKEASQFSTLWRLIHEALKAVRAERGAAASAFAALTPEGQSCSATSLLFRGPSIPALPVTAGGARVSGPWRPGTLRSWSRSTRRATAGAGASTPAARVTATATATAPRRGLR